MICAPPVSGTSHETKNGTHLLVHLNLARRTRHDLLLDGSLRHESQDSYLLLLTDTMGTILRLEILVRIPVTVKDDDGVGCG